MGKKVAKIEGELILKRRAIWVKRYAKIENQIFTYKKEKRDSHIRAVIDLRSAKVKYSEPDDQENGE